MSGAKVIGVGCAAWAAFVVVSIVRSSGEMSLGAGLRTIAATGWGVTTLVDLYAGLFFVAGWILCLERRKARAAAWIVALMLLGNLVTLVYVAIRAFRVASVREIFMPSLQR